MNVLNFIVNLLLALVLFLFCIMLAMFSYWIYNEIKKDKKGE